MPKKILVIDDDPLVLQSFKKLLAKAGYQPVTARSYQIATSVLETADFDLILSDIRMPEKNGVETVVEIQKRLAAVGKDPLPVVFITGYAEYADELSAADHGIVLYKPVDAPVLLSSLKEALS